MKGIRANLMELHYIGTLIAADCPCSLIHTTQQARITAAKPKGECMTKVLALIRTITVLVLLYLVYDREPVVRHTVEYVLINSADEIPDGRLVRMGLTFVSDETTQGE